MSERFSNEEARNAVGAEVEALRSITNVPAGTHGMIVGARRSLRGEWMVRVKWNLPPKKSEIWAQVFDFSINIRGKHNRRFLVSLRAILVRRPKGSHKNRPHNFGVRAGTPL